MPENPLPHGATPQSDFDSQYRRVFEAAECRTQVELAELLDIRQSSISDARRRKAVGFQGVVQVLPLCCMLKRRKDFLFVALGV